MALQIVFGRSGSGKTYYATQEIKERIKKNKKSIFVVPEQYTHIAEHKLLNAFGSISHETVEVTSFKKMIARAQHGNITDDILTPMTKSIIVSDILSYTELNYFSKISERTGFVDVCLNLIGEFKKYCITPQMLSEANEHMDNPRLKMKIDDILRIYKEYVKRLGEKGFDSDDGATLLAQYIGENNDYADTAIYFDEFTSFIPQELAIIRELARKCDDVVITLCGDGKDDMLFAPTMDTYAKIKRMCEEYGIELKPAVKLSGNKKHCRELAFLEENLLPYPNGKYDDDCEKVNIFSAMNPYEEVSGVARTILRLCRDGGYRYRDIAVVCSDIDTYSPFIKPVFEKHNISYFIDEKSPVLNHRIVTFVLNILDVYLTDYSNEAMFSFLKSGFCSADSESVNVLENYCKRTNMYKSTWLNDDKWNDLVVKRAESPDEAKKICDIRDKYVKPLSEFHDKIKGRHSGIHMCKALYEYIVSINLTEIIEDYLKIFEDEQDVNHGKEYESIWNIIVDALDSVSSVMGEKTLNVGNFRDLLKTAFSMYSIGVIPTSLDEVFVGNVERSRMDGIKVLFVLGVNDGIFPATITCDEIINDSDKEALSTSGIELSTNMTTKAFFERFYMYSVFTIASERLFVSFSRSDSSGNALRQSFVISDFKRVFPDLIIESDLLEDESDFGQMEYITSPNPTLEKLTEEITRFKDGKEISPVWLDVYNYFCENFDFGTKLNKYYNYTNRAFNIDPKLMQQFIPQEFYTTISRLQRYRSCNFSYFLEYMLKLRENSAFEISSLDTGSFVHGVLEKLCRQMGGDGVDFSSVTDEYINEKIDAYIEEFIKKLTDGCAYVSKRQLYLVKRLKGAIFKCFSLIRGHIVNSSFTPLGYEMSFNDENIGCIELEIEGNKKAKITGVIDRSDVYHGEDGDYVRVIDYKTGNKDFSLSDVFYGLDIQLFVYLNALVESNENYKYAGALYFRIDDPIFHGDHRYDEDKTDSKIMGEIKMKGLILGEEAVLSASDGVTASSAKKATYKNFVNLSNHLKKLLTNLCNEMIKGKIDIKPYAKGNFSPCQYCGYNTVCRFNSSKKGNEYEYLSSVKDEEIWESIGGENYVD